MIYQAQSRVLVKYALGADCFKLVFYCPPVAQACRPGHFLHIRVNPFSYPLLRRPMSIYDTDEKETVEIVFKVVGVGTGQLSQKKADDSVELLGPLGNNFTGLMEGEIGIMAAGGLGIVPVYYYAKYLAQRNGKNPIYFLYGAKTKSELYCLEDTERLEGRVFYSTDDGSHGFKGNLTQLLEQVIAKEKLLPEKIKIYACGPEPMLASLSEFAVSRKIFCELSLEVGMPCGMGTCMGCVVKCKNSRADQISFKRVCCEGPIFRAGEVIFD